MGCFQVLHYTKSYRSEILIRSYSANVAIMLMTTSRIMPHESKNGSMKLRQRTPQESNCSRYANVLRTPHARADPTSGTGARQAALIAEHCPYGNANIGTAFDPYGSEAKR